MKFINNISFDLKKRFVKNYLLFICPILISIGVFAEAINRIQYYKTIPDFGITEVSFGDLWFYLYGGMNKYVPSPSNPFIFPTIWIVVFATIAFLVLNYPLNNLMGVGSQILVKTKARSTWWFSKYLWNVLSTLTYHLILIATMFILCKLFHITLNLDIHEDLIAMLFKLTKETELINNDAIPIGIIILPILFSITINILQMTLSIFIKPVFSFLIVCTILISSAYLMSPFMIGNFAMPLRYKWIQNSGVLYQSGIIVCLVLLVILAVIGIIRFIKYDILNREEN